MATVKKPAAKPAKKPAAAAPAKKTSAPKPATRAGRDDEDDGRGGSDVIRRSGSDST